MKVLVTAGSTVVPIDQVRVISNIFHGKTGTAIARYLFLQGDEVTLMTSSPKLVTDCGSRLRVVPFRTHDDLLDQMESEIKGGSYDAVIHSAAVGDYSVAGVYSQNEDGSLSLLDNNTKISSNHDSLFLKMKPTLKIIDLIRNPWGFTGRLVKFKLEVGISNEELIKIAKKSRQASEADLIVANCLEWSRYYAYIITRAGHHIRVAREEIPTILRRALT